MWKSALRVSLQLYVAEGVFIVLNSLFHCTQYLFSEYMAVLIKGRSPRTHTYQLCTKAPFYAKSIMATKKRPSKTTVLASAMLGE